MYHSLNPALAKQVIEQRARVKRVDGIRRSARLVSLEIWRSRQAGHN